MNRATARKILSGYVEAPAARVLTQLGLSPNMLTILGLAIAGASAYLLGVGLLLAGGVVLLVSGIFDLFDGAVARATGRATPFGALLDSTVDRASEAVVLLGLVVYFLDRPSSLGVALGYLALVGSLLVSYVRARAEGLGVQCEVGVMTRPERVAALGVALIVGHWWLPAVSIVLAVIVALTLLTTIQRVLHVRAALEKPESPS